MYLYKRFRDIQSVPLSLLLATCCLCFLLSASFSFAQSVDAAAGKSLSAAAGQDPSQSTAIQAVSAQSIIPRQVPRPPLHIIRMADQGAAPVAPLAIPGAHATYFGGPVISNVHIVLVLYGTGAYLPNIAGTGTPTLGQFYTDITQSSYFDLLNEYSTVGVSAAGGSAGTNQEIGHGFFDGQFTINPAPGNNGSTITDSQIQSELLAQVAAGNLPVPVFDTQGNDDTLYMIFFPPGKTITAGGATSCVRGGFCAYHNSTTSTFASHRLFYGVHPDLQPPSGCSQGCGGSLNTFDNVTNVTSHELSEAVTDADVGPATAFAPPLAWVDPVNSEIGDICVGQEASIVANGTTYTVQQEFSDFQNNCFAVPPNFVFSGPFPSVTSGSGFDIGLALQSSGFIFEGSYTGTVHFTSSDPTAVLPPDYTFNTADSASHGFVFTMNSVGSHTITATDTQRPGVFGSTTVTVTTPSVSTFVVSAPEHAPVGVPVSFTVKAVDANFNVATHYSGPVHFSSSDPAAVLPADSNLVNGLGIFPVTFNTSGNAGQTLTVADAVQPTISGQATTIFVSAPGSNATATSVTVAANPSTFGQGVTYSATVTGASVPGGFVTFVNDGNDFQSTTPLDATGHAQATLNLVGGSHTIFAEYQGDVTHAPSSSAPLSVIVNPAPTTVSVTSSSASSTFGQNLTFTASLSSPVSGINFSPSGFVTFFDGALPLIVEPAPQIGQTVQLSMSSLIPGTHSITAQFSGTRNFAAGTSAPFVQVIDPGPATNYSLATGTQSATVSAGQSVTFNIISTSVGGFIGALKFACGNLPALTTCSFEPPITVLNTGTNGQTFLTIKTTGPHAQLLSFHKGQKLNALRWSMAPFALGLLVVAGVRRRQTPGGAVLFVFILCVLVGVSSCGGGSGPPPPPPVPHTTPAGTSTITVTSRGSATAGANPANPNQQITISLTVLQ